MNRYSTLTESQTIQFKSALSALIQATVEISVGQIGTYWILMTYTSTEKAEYMLHLQMAVQEIALQITTLPLSIQEMVEGRYTTLQMDQVYWKRMAKCRR